MNFAVDRLKPMLRALRSRNYRLFFMGQGLSLVGNWMTQTATIWLVYHLTGSPWMLGVVGFANQFPTFVLTPLAGVLIDKWNRHRTIVIMQILAMVESLLLAVLVLTGMVQIWHILVLSALQGCVNAFDMPARQSFVVNMVEDKADLGNAIALNSTMFSSARLIGPAIAGLVIATLGTGMCFLIDGISYLAVLAGLLAMQLPSFKKPTTHFAGNVWQQFKEGLDYAFGFPPIRAILLLIGLLSVAGLPYTTLTPIFAKEILHGDATTLGFMMAAGGLGSLLAAVYLSTRLNVLGLSKLMAIAPAMFGASLITFALSRTLWLSLLALVMLGISLILQHTSGNTILQTIVEEDKRGRVMSLYMMAFTSMSTFGNLFAGAIASYIGAPNTLIIGGCLCIAGAIAFTRQLPTMRQHIRPIYRQLGVLP